MAHMIETMAYVGETPWHGLGTALPAGVSVDEMIKAAGLDWEVSKVQLQTPDGRKVDRFAVVRSTDNAILGDVGGKYRLLQNHKAFEWFRPFVDSGLASLETAGALFDGARVWVLAKLNQKDDVIVAKTDDRVARYILLAHAHDGSLAIHGGYTATRVVCHNTLSVALHNDNTTTAIRIRHTKSAGDALKAAQEAIMQAGRQFERAAEVFRALAKTGFSEAQLTAYLSTLFPSTKRKEEVEAQAKAEFSALLQRPITNGKSELEWASEAAERHVSRAHDRIVEILESGGRNGDLRDPAIRGTAWAAYNAVTEYLTWDHGRSEDNRLSNVWFGNVGDRALQTAQQTFLAAA